MARRPPPYTGTTNPTLKTPVLAPPDRTKDSQNARKDGGLSHKHQKEVRKELEGQEKKKRPRSKII